MTYLTIFTTLIDLFTFTFFGLVASKAFHLTKFKQTICIINKWIKDLY